MLVLDVQGYKISKNTFTPKELAFYDGIRFSHYIFKPPFPWQMLQPEFKKQAIWVMNNHHCIKWEEGFTPHYYFPQILQRICQKSDAIYVKGLEKAAFIRKFTSTPVHEFGEQPALVAREVSCYYHSNTICYCALTNVKYLFNNYVREYEK